MRLGGMFFRGLLQPESTIQTGIGDVSIQVRKIRVGIIQ